MEAKPASLLHSVIIVTYNSSSTILDCLCSLISSEHGDIEIAVVDNSSRDNTVELVRKFSAENHFPLRLIENRDNRGFAVASNQGVRATSAPFVLFLNPDTVVPPLALSRLSSHLINDQSAGAAGPLSNFVAGEQSVALHWPGALPVSASPEEAAHYLHSANSGKVVETRLLIGFALMTRRSLLSRLGGLDERLFLGGDDLEFSWRVRLHGYRLLVATDCFVYHEGGKSFKSESRSSTDALVQKSYDALYRILLESYGTGRVPPPEDIWGIDWFRPAEASFNRFIRFDEALSLPKAREYGESLVSIIILAWNQLDYTRECLESVKRNTRQRHEIIVVDNGSTDGTTGWLKEMALSDQRVRPLFNEKNQGFAAGCNRGMAAARGEWMVLLNNDTVVTEEWLDALLDCHRTTPHAGVVGPLSNNASGIQGLCPAPSYGAGGLSNFARQLRVSNLHRHVFSRRLVGFCMLFHRSLYELIGGFEERFGTGNFEDDDFCLRAAVGGFRNVVAADVYIHHYGSVTFKGEGIDYSALLGVNGEIFRRKWSEPVSDPEYAARIASCRIREDAALLLQSGKRDEALHLLRSGIEKYPSAPLLLEQLKTALRHAGKFRMRALSGDRIAEAYALIENGDAYASRRLLLSLKHECPGSGEIDLLLSFIIRGEGREEYADALLLRAFRLDPPLVAGHFLDNRERLRILRYGEVLDAARLYPESRDVSALLVLASQEPEATLSAAESFIARFGADDEILQMGLRARRITGLHDSPALVMPAVSLCMITRDEEKQLPHALLSLRPVVSQIVVADTGSADATPDIAELYGAKVLRHEWKGDFSEARNRSLDAATGEWILVMDADERLSPRDHELFRAILSKAGRTAFSFTTRNYSPHSGIDGIRELDGGYPDEERGAGWTPSGKIRLFPNVSGIRFAGRIHELLEESVLAAGIPVLGHPVPVHHYGNLEKGRQKRKQEEYYRLGQLKLAEERGNSKAIYELAVQAGELGKFEEAAQLWLDYLRHDPASARAWFNLGYVCLRSGRIGEAMTATCEAMNLQPGHAGAVVNRAICRFLLDPKGIDMALDVDIAAFPDEPALKILFLSGKCFRGESDGVSGLFDLQRGGVDASLFLEELGKLFRMRGDDEGGAVSELLSNALAGCVLDNF